MSRLLILKMGILLSLPSWAHSTIDIGQPGPAPILRITQGSKAPFTVSNNSHVSMAFFFHGAPGGHGLKTVLRSWGTEEISHLFYTDLIQSHSSRTVHFPTQTKGAYLYRSCSLSQGGVYGVAIVDDGDSPHQDIVFVAGPQGQIQGPSQGTSRKVRLGEKIDIFLFNTWPRDFISFRIGNLRPFRVISKDNRDVVPVLADSLFVAPGESYKITFTMPQEEVSLLCGTPYGWPLYSRSLLFGGVSSSS